MKITFLAFFIFLSGSNSLATVTTDTHPQLCTNIRDQISEDCSEEPAGRTYEECLKEDLADKADEVSKLLYGEVNELIFDETGIRLFDKYGSADRLECVTE